MKQFVLPERMVKAPSKNLIPQTIIIDAGEKMLSIVFSNDEVVQLRDQDLDEIISFAMDMAASHESLESAIIEDVPDTPGEKTQE